MCDRRQREPYLNHLLRVAIRVISHYGVRDAEVVCAALLHDAVEDHWTSSLAVGSGPRWRCWPCGPKRVTRPRL